MLDLSIWSWNLWFSVKIFLLGLSLIINMQYDAYEKAYISFCTGFRVWLTVGALDGGQGKYRLIFRSCLFCCSMLFSLHLQGSTWYTLFLFRLIVLFFSTQRLLLKVVYSTEWQLQSVSSCMQPSALMVHPLSSVMLTSIDFKSWILIQAMYLRFCKILNGDYFLNHSSYLRSWCIVLQNVITDSSVLLSYSVLVLCTKY
jgi:hypothetical protein